MLISIRCSTIWKCRQIFICVSEGVFKWRCCCFSLVIAPWGCLIKSWSNKWMNVSPSNCCWWIVERDLILTISLFENYMNICGLIFTLCYPFSSIGFYPIHILISMPLCDSFLYYVGNPLQKTFMWFRTSKLWRL